VQAANVEEFLIVVQLDEDGEFSGYLLLKLSLKSILTNKLSRQCISWETKMLQWEYDPSDGEIRAIIEFPWKIRS